MTKSMHASLTSVGRRTHAGYFPPVTKPLPCELRDLVAQLVSLEIGKRARIARATHRGLAIHYRAVGTAVAVNQGVDRSTD